MIVISKAAELLEWRKQQEGRTIGFVPTMGALHEGHLSLIQNSKKQTDATVVSIFVNPLQFVPGEDYQKYPRPIELDEAMCLQNEVGVLFLPAPSEVYTAPLDELSKVLPRQAAANCLCGLARPGHFEGVLTIVLKLFNLIRPHKAFFGEKDFQQLRLIELMLSDFNLDVEIVRCPIIRLTTGLAMSSRNKYLNEAELLEAAELYKTLQQAKTLIQQGQTIKQVLTSLKKSHFEYFEARDPETLQLCEALPARLFIAAKVGAARLIDNLAV